MSRLEELRARKKVTRNTEKKLYCLGSEPSKPTEVPFEPVEVPFEGYEGAIPQESQFFLQPDQSTGDTPSLVPEKEAAQAPADRNSGNSTNSNPIVPDQTPLEPPARDDRFCYQCQHFRQSPYGFPLGLCQQHGMPEGSLSQARGNRPQHATGRPTRFGCGEFAFRQASDDSKTCLECRHYNPLFTMCSQVNTGCPYPSIPPCSGTRFQQKLKAVQSSKGTTKLEARS